jgi:MaoC like domain
VPQRHWEDFSPGSVSEFGPRLVTRDEIVEFAAAFDPQPMHLDEAAARASMLGQRAALIASESRPAPRILFDRCEANSPSQRVNAAGLAESLGSPHPF